MSTQNVFVVLTFCLVIRLQGAESQTKAIYLPVDGRELHATVNESRELAIFCFPGRERTIPQQVWVNPRLTIEGYHSSEVPSDLKIYHGNNETEIKESVESTRFTFNRLKTEHSFSPFNLSCIGLSSQQPYRVSFRIKNPELWYIAYIFAGIVIFFSAPSWSRNVAFHYGTGVSVGVLASVLVLVFILTRFLPQRLKTLSYLMIVMGGSASLYMLEAVKKGIKDLCGEFWQYLLGYAAVASLVSFALIYRFGPITDTRSLNLVQWVLQAFGLVLIYQGTQMPEASAAIIILVLTVYHCPRSLPCWMKSLQFRVFPRKHRFLTEEEYIRQGETETRKALAELREYCRSPDCDKWKTISRLQSPSKFAKFVEGDSHVSADEVDEHDGFVPLEDEDFSDVSDHSDSEAETSVSTHQYDRTYRTFSHNRSDGMNSFTFRLPS